MNKLIERINEWKKIEFEEYYTPITQEGIVNLAETNAEYDDNLTFGVDINTKSNEITWYISKYNSKENTDECLLRTNIQFKNKEEIIEFLNKNNFDDIVSDKYYEKSGISKYKD